MHATTLVNRKKKQETVFPTISSPQDTFFPRGNLVGLLNFIVELCLLDLFSEDKDALGRAAYPSDGSVGVSRSTAKTGTVSSYTAAEEVIRAFSFATDASH